MPSADDLLAHTAWVRGLARSLVGSENDADDVVQSAWLAGLEKPPLLRVSLRAWLRSVVRHAVLLKSRREKQRTSVEKTWATREEVPSTDDVVERAELHRKLVDHVLALNEPGRSTILMRYFDGVALKDIAMRCGVPEGTVRARNHRALAQLRQSLSAEAPGSDWRSTILPLAGLGVKAGGAAGAGATGTGIFISSASAKAAAPASVLIIVAVLCVGLTLHETGGPQLDASAAPADAAPAISGSRAATTPIRPTAFVNRPAVAGRVVDEHGAPIAGAMVTVGGSFEVRTDDLGRFEASDLEGATCEALAQAPGFAWRVVKGIRLVPGGTVDVTIVLEARPEHLGRVVGPDEVPVAGADVVIQYGRLMAFAGSTNEREISRTADEGGWFSFPSPEPPLVPVRARVRREGVGVGSAEAAALDDPAEVVTIRLLPARTVVIRFVPDDGSPPPGDLGFSIRDGNYWAGGRTDPNGVGTIREFPTTDSVVIHGDAHTWQVPGEPPRRWGRTFALASPGDVELTVPLKRMPPPPATGVVEGMVTDASGRPVEGATVNSQMPVAIGLEAKTDSDGRFRLTGIMPVRNCRVGASRGRGPPTWSEAFELAPGATVTGVTIVVGAKPDLVVDVVDPDGRPAMGVVVALDDETPAAVEPLRTSLVTDANGRAVFEAAPAVRVRIGVDPASLPAGVGSDDDVSYGVVLAWPREAPFVVRLRREIVLRGTLVGEDGVPIDGGTLRFWAKDRPTTEPSPPEAVPNPPRGPEVDRYARVGLRGEFTLRVKTRFDYAVRDLCRVVRAPGAAGRIDVFEPAAPARLMPDAPNVVVMKRRED